MIIGFVVTPLGGIDNMSIFLPYSVSEVINTFTTWFSLDLSSLSDYQSIILTILANAYFFGFWFFIIYFSLKSLNWVYERLC